MSNANKYLILLRFRIKHQHRFLQRCQHHVHNTKAETHKTIFGTFTGETHVSSVEVILCVCVFNSTLHQHSTAFPLPASPLPHPCHAALLSPSPLLSTPLTQTPPVQPRPKSTHNLKSVSSKSPFSQSPPSPPPNPSMLPITTKLNLTRDFHFLIVGLGKTALMMLLYDFN